MLIDTHCHIARGRLGGRATELLAGARQASVTAMICATSDLDESKAAVALAREHASIWRLAGVHPHDAANVNDETLRQIEDLARLDENCLAIGEIGLDYHYDYSPRDEQRRAFAAQLDLAARLDRPIVIHTREAFDDTMAILGQAGVDGQRVIFHSFTGNASQCQAVLDFGSAVSYSGIVTFNSAEDIRTGARLVPAERILVETDAPFLSPEPVRKQKTNTPANVAHVARFLAELRGCDLETFAAQTTANAERLFARMLTQPGQR